MAEFDERRKKAFDFVSDYTKQLITLATGIIALTVTFLGEELKNGSVLSKVFLIVSWALFTVSICSGVMRLMAMTANLDPIDPALRPALTITTRNVRNRGIWQILTFLGALLFSTLFGIIQLFGEHKKADKDKTIIILQQPPPCNGKTLPADTLYPVKPKSRHADCPPCKKNGS